jgi:hypothetical protein
MRSLPVKRKWRLPSNSVTVSFFSVIKRFNHCRFRLTLFEEFLFCQISANINAVKPAANFVSAITAI